MPVTKYTTAKGVRWRVRYTTPAGKYTDKRGFPTKKQAEAWEAQNVLAIASGTYVSPTGAKVRFGTMLDEFIARGISLAPTTAATRMSTARVWVSPHWDGWKLEDITPAAIDDWVDEMRRKGAKETTVEKAYRVLNGTMQRAVDRRVIMANPTPRLRQTKRKVARKRAYLSITEVTELAEVIEPRSKLLILVLAFTGLRFGEAAALHAEDVDVNRRRIDVRRAVAEVHGQVVESTPKSGRARTVPIPGFLIEQLREVQVSRRPDDLMFPAARGGHLRLTTWRRRVFYPAIAEANEKRERDGCPAFPAVTPHDLRHTAASLAVTAGANVKVLQRIMGHSSASLTLDVYADLFESDLDAVSARMEELMNAV